MVTSREVRAQESSCRRWRIGLERQIRGLYCYEYCFTMFEDEYLQKWKSSVFRLVGSIESPCKVLIDDKAPPKVLRVPHELDDCVIISRELMRNMLLLPGDISIPLLYGAICSCVGVVARLMKLEYWSLEFLFA